jgi:two-component system chemotaxis sensor kinase CheA
MSGVSDMVLARNELARRLRESRRRPVDGAFERLSSIIAEMRDAITRTRMQRIENLFVGLPRMVRDLSAELGKQVLVDIEGGDVELDREMIEMIRDPLTHIIRNAVDHGIERPAERLKAGKREIGMLSVSARQSGNQILIDIPTTAAASTARSWSRRRSPPASIDKADAAQLPARAARADLRGRPVDRQGGHRRFPAAASAWTSSAPTSSGSAASSRSTASPGEGTRMTLRVPLTLTIIPALTVSIGGQHFAIPRSAIEEIVRANGDRVTLESAAPASRRSAAAACPKSALADILGLDSDVADEGAHADRAPPGRRRRLRARGRPIHDHEELVVKPAAPAVMATGLYAGTTLADDGSPILLFDPPGSPRSAASSSKRRSAPRASPRDPRVVSRGSGAAVPRPRRRRRALRLAVVDRIEEVARARSSRRRPASRPARRSDPAAGRGAKPAPSWATARSACSASTTAATRSATPSPR